MEEDSWWKDTFAPLIEVGKWIKSIVPTRLRFSRPKFNFIMVHYLYILGTTIVWSIMLFPIGNMAYIDALFFAAGTSTQSGLNTIDINKLTTYQQVIFMLGCCICTPVWINTAVVFVRLYWFERRFEHIVKEIRENRRARSLSFTKSRSKSNANGDRGDEDHGRLERGVRGKPIEILRNTIKLKNIAKSDSEEKEEKDHGVNTVVDKSNSTSSGSVPDGESSSEATVAAQDAEKNHKQNPADEPESPQTPFMGLHPRLNRGIVFADEVDSPGIRDKHEVEKAPEQQDKSDLSKHIAFLERQQANRSEAGALYIPGPREMEHGEAPTRLDQDEAMRRLHSRPSVVSQQSDVITPQRSPGDQSQHSQQDEIHHTERGITIQEPDHPGHRDEHATGRRVQSKDGLTHRRNTRGIQMTDAPRSFARTWSRGTTKGEDPMPYLSWTATTGRNSAFLGLTAEQRDELGGIEYRALKTLAGILLCYFFLIHLIGLIVFVPWIVRSETYSSVVRGDGQNPVWWGIFTPASMFNDLGFTLTPDSMISFNETVLPLLFGSFLIVIGNTGFPVFLRFIVWVLAKFALWVYGPESELYLELRFLLDHPRRCFTLLFPSKANWWLFWVLVLLNGIDLIFFVILDLNNTPVEGLSGGFKVLNGWFQAVSTRTAGFASVNLAELHAAIQVSYLVMMYISVFPIAISVRRTNVYEEKSLGLFGGEEEGDGEQSYVSQHLRRQLSFDLWYIFLGLFIIAIVEGDRIANTNEPAFTTFSVLFEIVSAYGTVGLSLGYDNTNTSFSAQFRTISKLVIIAMMIRGRHRGLPYALDRAILLPSEKLQQKEAEESERQLEFQRRGSIFDQGVDWEAGDLDNSGLPRQHTIERAMDMGAGGVSDHTGLRKINTRRSTALSTRSQGGGAHQRSRSLSRIIAGGLSAGPTFGKKD